MNMYLSNTLLLLNLTYFSKKLLKPHFKYKLLIPIVFLLGVILLSYRNYTTDSLIGTLIMTLFYIFYTFTFFKGSVYRKSLVIILFILTISFSEILIANLMNYLFNLNASHIASSTYTFALILSNIITFSILSVIENFMKIEVADNYSKYMWFSLILPMTTLLFLFNFSDYFNTFRDHIMTLIIVVGLILSNIITLLSISKEFKRIELDNEIKKTKLKYDILNTQYNTNFYFLHDTIRKLTKLSNHIDRGNYKQFQSDVMELNQNLTRSINTISSNSEILNSLLNYRIADINKYNINIKTVIEYNTFNFITLEDQRFLFSEVLSISINSCINENISNPRIIIKTKEVNKQATIQCSFSYRESHNIYSTELHKLIAKYHGLISEEVKVNQGKTYYDILIVFF